MISYNATQSQKSKCTIGHVIFAWLSIWRKNATYVMPFRCPMKNPPLSYVIQIKFISSMYMPRHNFWCMTRGISTPEGGWSIHFRRDPKGITYVAFFLQIESHAKMRLPSAAGYKSIFIGRPCISFTQKINWF